MIPSEKIIFFTRYPVPGKTKTRLIPSLGPAGAANVHRRLAEGVFSKVKQYSKEHLAGLEVSYTGGSLIQMTAWLGKYAEFSRQCPGDLGKKMYSSFKGAFKKGSKRIILIGTDVPDITLEHLKKAFYDLQNNDLVLGPSIDGGYWLIGMKKPYDLFSGVSWGRETVLNHTLNIAANNKLKVSLLTPLNDIDTVDDLSEWEPDGQWKNPYLSIIIPVLNEADRIEKVINNARNKGSEIIVVDGGSDDKTVITAHELGTKVIKSNRGRAIQQNMGAAASKGEVLLFLHADTLLPSDYPEIVFNTLAGNQTVIGAFKFKTDMNIPYMRFIELMVNLRSHCFSLPYGDQGLFMTKSFFESTGGFPLVPIAEDLFFVRNNFKKAPVKIAPGYAVTSARRWQKLGLFRTTVINFIIMLGCYLGIRPEKLFDFYNIAGPKRY